jgi:hypothetical protein
MDPEPSTPTAPDLPRSTGFTRELTPTWLATAALVAGQRPPDLGRIERYVQLGAGNGETAAVVAANHPNTDVWVWDRHPEHLDSTRRLADAAGLANLAVHEHRDLPLDLGGGPADVIVVQDVLAAVDDHERARISTAVGATLRPGGLLCVTYPTLVGWAEIAPVQALLRQLALAHRGQARDLVPSVLDVLERLRAGGARYLIHRPVVAAWLDALRTLDPAELTARYLRDPFRPMSPAHVAATFAIPGCELVGSARLTDDLDLDLSPELAERVSGAVNRVLQETYRDLATRRSYRLDVYRLGGSPLSAPERHEQLGWVGLAGLAAPEEPPAVAVGREAWQQLTSFGVTAAALHDDPEQVGRIVRILMDAGQAHPVVAGGPTRAATEACEALNAALAADGPADVQAMPLLGSAISSARASTVRGIPAGRGSS